MKSNRFVKCFDKKGEKSPVLCSLQFSCSFDIRHFSVSRALVELTHNVEIGLPDCVVPGVRCFFF